MNFLDILINSPHYFKKRMRTRREHLHFDLGYFIFIFGIFCCKKKVKPMLGQHALVEFLAQFSRGQHAASFLIAF